MTGRSAPSKALVPLTIASRAPQSLGPLSIEVVPETGDSLDEFSLSSGHQEQQIMVPAGRYAVIARRPNGERLYRSIVVQDGAGAALSFSDRLPASPNEFMQIETSRGEVAALPQRPSAHEGLGVVRGYAEQAVKSINTGFELRKIAQPAKAQRWTLRIWAAKTSNSDALNSAHYHVDAGASFLKVTTRPGCFAIGFLNEEGIGPIVMTPPFTQQLHIAFPAECLLSQAAARYSNPSGQRALVALVTHEDPMITDLLTALGSPQVEHSEALWAQNSQALEYVYNKYEDPAKALVGAHYLLRFLPDKLPSAWTDNLSRILADAADGPVIAGWLRLRCGSRNARKVTPKQLAKQADAQFAEARRRPVTWFARTRRLLVDSKSLTVPNVRRGRTKPGAVSPSDYLDYGAHAGGLEAFWGRHPFSPGREIRPDPLPSRDLGVFTLADLTFTRAEVDEVSSPVSLGGPLAFSVNNVQETVPTPDPPAPAMQKPQDRGSDMPVDRDRFRKSVDDTFADRKRVRNLVHDQRWREAETNRTRAALFAAKTAAMTQPRGAESLTGDTNDLQAAWFLPAGAKTRLSIAYVESNNAGVWEAGSGFMISPDLFITNQHVIRDEVSAHAAQITFGRETDDTGRSQPTTVFNLDPGRFALFSQEEELDYAVIAVGSKVSGAGTIGDFGYCVLSDHPDKHVLGMNVNIIQHPNAFPKMIAVRNNLLTARTPNTLLYETDTLKGSSGSPVLNDAWEVVALHHYGEPFLEKVDENGRPFPVTVNEGIRISAIYRNLESRLPLLSAAQQALLKTALDYSKQIPVGAGGRRLTPPHASSEGSESLPLTTKDAVMPDTGNSREMRVIIPIEVTVRVGGAGQIEATSAATIASRPLSAGPGGIIAAPRVLTSGAEKLPIDRDYTNRDGYDPKFISGLNLPLPLPVGKLAKQVAPLRPGEPKAELGELKYQHFSIKMNKSKRIALFSATNIDGNAYLNVDRITGEVTDAAEGETWYSDPRISASFFLDQTFYSDWSNLFDRGHLTRRMDPNWGSKEEAERANADTYHFTNCSPQHFRFNESTKFWQGAERYILENGAIAAESQNRICVFQGPIFNDKIDLWSDDVQIPSSFFKVIVWKGKQGLRSVGLVVDQLDLLSEQRVGGIKPKPVDFVSVKQWRVSLKEIEERTNLDFGDAVRDADTIKQEKQPVVGEAKVIVKSKDDLLPKAAAQ
ncbi:DNA/RNA endonuclease G (NUC1)/V8-like Glu-specific endopeptidase [Bradyrhizobium elkanii]|uniref:DNA/RNA non-specific endonuclease n=1 Tax=Bradyrhizobium elkanii TaxID=29448 RepID=UPI002167EDB6|nr:DNA/RNA non-specific endonuclease [Bradyrhizobium elkanii]MCS3476097.1 DNA/RNA endonuclease G (NUC1)/V8-like Glu-specific endopeptidase [Bradyrhizobium elkanii]